MPILFTSRTLEPVERTYVPLKRDGLAVVLVGTYVYKFIVGRQVTY